MSLLNTFSSPFPKFVLRAYHQGEKRKLLKTRAVNNNKSWTLFFGCNCKPLYKNFMLCRAVLLGRSFLPSERLNKNRTKAIFFSRSKFSQHPVSSNSAETPLIPPYSYLSVVEGNSKNTQQRHRGRNSRKKKNDVEIK